MAKRFLRCTAKLHNVLIWGRGRGRKEVAKSFLLVNKLGEEKYYANYMTEPCVENMANYACKMANTCSHYSQHSPIRNPSRV